MHGMGAIAPPRCLRASMLQSEEWTAKRPPKWPFWPATVHAMLFAPVAVRTMVRCRADANTSQEDLKGNSTNLERLNRPDHPSLLRSVSAAIHLSAPIQLISLRNNSPLSNEN